MEDFQLKFSARGAFLVPFSGEQNRRIADRRSPCRLGRPTLMFT